MAALLALPEGGEWIVILVIVVLVFGANKLPDLTRNAARAMVEFKKVTGKDEPDAKTEDAGTTDPAADDEAAKPKQESPPT
jgi:sec-independent protein translocase protein TatA